MSSLGCQKGGTTVMEKHRTKAPVADPIFPSLTLASTSQQLLPRAVLDTRLALRDFLLASGLKELQKAFEEDRTLLCGPKGKVQTDRRAYRHGHDVGELVLGGRTGRTAKPRVRTVDGCELELPHWRHFGQEGPPDERAQRQILLGVRTRGYAGRLEARP